MVLQAPSAGVPARNTNSAPLPSVHAASAEANPSQAVEGGDTALQQPENSRRAQAAADEAFARVAAVCAPSK